jgi:hypothetical protein
MGQSQDPSSRGLPPVRGRPFRKGNGGRKAGSRNRATVIAAALVEGDEAALCQKAKEIALAGDVPMLKFFLGRMLPRERLIKLDLPRMNFADDAVEVLCAIMLGIAEGRITPSEGAALTTVVNSTARAIEIADLVKRVDALAKQNEADALEKQIRQRVEAIQAEVY